LNDSALGTGHPALSGSIPLFPKLEASSTKVNMLTIRNAGDTILRARSYGEPGYRLIANGHWLQLPCDLAPGESADVELPKDLRGTTVTLLHAMQGIPMLEPEVWARVKVQ